MQAADFYVFVKLACCQLKIIASQAAVVGQSITKVARKFKLCKCKMYLLFKQTIGQEDQKVEP